MQEFSSLMKSMLHDNKDIIRDHQDKIAQVHHTIKHMPVANLSLKQHLTLQGSMNRISECKIILCAGKQTD